jgi:tetratricopeptide (TPR) repeat protein
MGAKLAEKTTNRNEFTEFINHCITVAKRLENRGNLESAAEWRIKAARTYKFTEDAKSSVEQYLLAAGLYEKIATMNEKSGYNGHAAFNMERAGDLYSELLNRDKTKECYSKAIELSNLYLMRRQEADPNYMDVFERSNISRLMRKVGEADKI